MTDLPTRLRELAIEGVGGVFTVVHGNSMREACEEIESLRAQLECFILKEKKIKIRAMSSTHPIHGMSWYEISSEACFIIRPFEDWGIKASVFGPTEKIEVEADFIRIYEIEERCK